MKARKRLYLSLLLLLLLPYLVFYIYRESQK
jgi:hypothetical protein